MWNTLSTDPEAACQVLNAARASMFPGLNAIPEYEQYRVKNGILVRTLDDTDYRASLFNATLFVQEPVSPRACVSAGVIYQEETYRSRPLDVRRLIEESEPVVCAARFAPYSFIQGCSFHQFMRQHTSKRRSELNKLTQLHCERVPEDCVTYCGVFDFIRQSAQSMREHNLRLYAELEQGLQSLLFASDIPAAFREKVERIQGSVHTNVVYAYLLEHGFFSDPIILRTTDSEGNLVAYTLGLAGGYRDTESVPSKNGSVFWALTDFVNDFSYGAKAITLANIRWAFDVAGFYNFDMDNQVASPRTAYKRLFFNHEANTLLQCPVDKIPGWLR